MRLRLILGWLVVLTMVAAIGYAQEAPPARRLSLAEAQQIAREHNPTYLRTIEARSPASWSLRNATASLFTPSVSVQAGYAYRQAGKGQVIQGFPVGATPSLRETSTSLGFGYQLSGASITNRGYASAQLAAADQNIAGARTTLETSVKTEYLNLLQARAQADLAKQVVARAQELLNLAQAQFNVGQKTMIDVRQAQVAKGQADVQLLQAQQNVQVEVLKLYQILGVPAPEPPNVVPTDTFPVVQPAYSQDSLVSMALESNPALLSYRAQARAAHWSVRGAYSQYLPSIQASASTGKQWTNQSAFTTTVNGAALQVPASHTSQTSPWFISVGVSLPIFQAFGRNLQVSQAKAQEEDLRLSIRAQELAVRANVSAAYLALVTAYQTIGVQENNRTAADEALQLAEEQYRVGSGSIIQLLDARVASQTAGVDYINAVYNYHKAEAALEQAVGRPLQ